MRSSIGTVVETSYTVEGRTIVQSVATTDEALYPVVADPEFVWGWVTGTIYFDVAETGMICYAAYNSLVYMMAGAPFWALTVIGNVIAGILLVVALFACSVKALGQCLKIKTTLAMSEHSGSRCT